MTDFEVEVESLVGQFCYAFGAGTGRLRVDSDTIKCLQARYRPYLDANLRTESGRRGWAEAKYHLLDYLTAMGRYAASLALQAGEMTILKDHFEVAARRFEAAAHRSRSRVFRAGPWCPGGASEDRPGLTQPEGEFQGGRWPSLHV